MTRYIFYLIMAILIGGWAIGRFYLGTESYVDSLLVIAGLVVWFRYVYQLKPAS